MISVKPDRSDYFILSGYLFGWFLIWCAYFTSLVSQNFIHYGMIFMGLLVPIFMYAWYYKRLRFTFVFLIWLIIGIFQFMLMFFLKKNPDFDGFNGSYAFTLAYLPCMLFSYTLMRWVYKLLYREELIITAHRFPWMDDEGREWNRMDYILSILGASLFLILPTLLLA